MNKIEKRLHDRVRSLIERYPVLRSFLLSTAKERFTEKLTSGEGAYCPCCGHYAKYYRRSLYRKPLVWLANLAKVTKRGNFVYAWDVEGYIGGGDFAKMRFWGLCEPGEQFAHWRITKLGIKFVEGRCSVPRYAIEFRSDVIRVEGEPIMFAEAMQNGFDLDAVMNEKAGA